MKSAVRQPTANYNSVICVTAGGVSREPGAGGVSFRERHIDGSSSLFLSCARRIMLMKYTLVRDSFS